MKRGIKIIEAVLCVCAVFGWWGVLYPELAMTPDTYKVVREGEASLEEKPFPEETALSGEKTVRDEANSRDNKVQKITERDFDRDIYFEILQADAGQVRFKSRLLMSLGEIFK